MFYLLILFLALCLYSFNVLNLFLPYIDTFYIFFMVQTNFSSLNNQVNHIVEIGGFVNSVRDHGGLIFIDLRSQSDLVQCVINPENNQEIFDLAQTIGSESVLKITGKIVNREAKLINPKIISGKIEIIVEKLEIVAKANVLPFEIDGQNVANEELRLKYRYLDLRRNKLKEMLTTKSKLFLAVRNWFDTQNFVEVQTPILANSSPEGARDFLIPSRLHPGKFYALPQAPQQFKQLLMVAGFNRYFQIAPCFRDEDPRSDRHPGDFYQIDAEMAWSDQDDIYDFNWQFIQEVLTKFTTKKLDPEFTKIRYDDGMDWFGSDKPDLRIKNSNSQKTTPNQDIERFNFLLEKAKNDKIDQIVCSTIFTNGEDELFVAKRHLNSTLGAGKYEFVGGKMEKDETFWQTLERELKEETDLNLVEIVDYLPVDKDFSLNEKNYRVLYFYVRVSGQIKLNKEHLDYKFIASSEDLKAEENHEGEAKISQVLSLIKVLNDEKIEKNMMQDKNWIKQDWDISTLQIETERLILKPVSLDYAEDIFREFTPEVTQNLLTQPTGNFEDTRKFILKNQEKMQQKMGIQMVILNKNGEFLGITSLNNIGKPELLPSIWLKTTAQNQGFGNEAFTAMFEWAKKHFNFEYIAYGVFEGNERSFKIAKKLGGKFVLDFEMPIKDGRIVKVLEYHIPNPGYEKPIQTQDKNWIIDNLGWLDTKHIFRNSGFKAFADLCENQEIKNILNTKNRELLIEVFNNKQKVRLLFMNEHFDILTSQNNFLYVPELDVEKLLNTNSNFTNEQILDQFLKRPKQFINQYYKESLDLPDFNDIINISIFRNNYDSPFYLAKCFTSYEFEKLMIIQVKAKSASNNQLFLKVNSLNSPYKDDYYKISTILKSRHANSNSRVQALVIKNAVDKFSRSDLDKIQEIGRSFGLPGLAYIQYLENETKSPILKFLDEDKQLEIQNYLGAEAGDLVLFVAHSDKNLVHKAQNAIRKHIAQKLDLIDNNSLKFAWVYDFPFFEETDDGKIDFAHNPFGIFQNWAGLTHLETLQKARAENRLLELRAIQYDIACNGYEVLSGGRRNNIPECLMEGFKLVGYTEEEVKEKFGHMMEAYSYGAPTHAGFAWGIDRLFMVLVDEDNIREIIAFPKNGSGMDLMMNSPRTVRESQLKELSIKNI